MEHQEVLLIGFGELTEKLKNLLEAGKLEVMTFGAEDISQTVGQLVTAGGSEKPEEPLDRGLVMFHNFTREGLDPALKILREAGIPKQPLKAMVTPTNWHWKVQNLLQELQQEQQLMGELIKLKQLRDTIPMPAFTDIPAMKAWMAAEVQFSGGESVTLETIRSAYEGLLKLKK